MAQIYNGDWEAQDIRALIDGCKDNGVVSGLAVSESSPAAMSVLVASGTCDVDDSAYTEGAGQNLAISNGDATHPRKDIVIYDTSAGNPAIVEGTPAAAPVAPDIPADDIYLAMVHVAANESTSIVNADIDEGRVYINLTRVVPTGIISMWHGLIANIPTGWVLCNGANSTPDLRSKFLRGAPNAIEAGGTGGADTHTLTTNEMPAHVHTGKGNSATSGSNTFSTGGIGVSQTATTESTGGGAAHNNMPAYYQILFIMKT